MLARRGGGGLEEMSLWNTIVFISMISHRYGAATASDFDTT